MIPECPRCAYELARASADDRIERIKQAALAYGAACRVSGTGPEVKAAWQAFCDALET